MILVITLAMVASVAGNKNDADPGASGVRLAGGFSPATGRLEMQLENGSWATVCRSPFDVLVPMLACKQMGRGQMGTAYVDDRFGPGEGPLFVHEVRCGAFEGRLQDCFVGPANSTACHLGNTTSISCSGIITDGGAPTNAAVVKGLRLAGGTTNECGLLEVLVNNTYGGVCTTGFDDSAASVVCGQLGLAYDARPQSQQSYSSRNYGYDLDFGSSSGPIWMDQVACTGNETSLEQCNILGWNATECEQQVSLHCYNATALAANPNMRNCSVDWWRGAKMDGMRLVNGTARTNGRLEVLVNGTWGTASAYGPPGSLNAVQVICKQLGLGSYGYLFNDTRSTGYATSPPLWITNITCTGRESKLEGCDVSHGSPSRGAYSSGQPMIIACADKLIDAYDGLTGNPLIPPVIEELRLGNGTSRNNGYLEVKSNGQWGGVDRNGMDSTSALVACRHLGFTGTIGEIGGSPTPYSPGIVYSWNVTCSGIETQLAACKFKDKGSAGSQNPAYIMCVPPEGWQLQDVRLVNTTLNNGSTIVRSLDGATNRSQLVTEGRLEVWASGTEWGTVSNATFGQNEAMVACRTLFFPDTTKASVYTLGELRLRDDEQRTYSHSTFETYLPMWVRQISCTGQETKLRDCRITWCDETCPVGGPVGVQCT